MNIRLSLVKKIDGRAVAPLAALVYSYIQGHPNVGTIEICPNEIRFTKGVFFTVGRIDYRPYQIECRNGVVYYEGVQTPNVVKDNLYILLVNVLHQLSPQDIWLNCSTRMKFRCGKVKNLTTQERSLQGLRRIDEGVLRRPCRLLRYLPNLFFVKPMKILDKRQSLFR